MATLNATQLIRELRADFETLLNLVTGPTARTATVGQMERSLFRHLLQMGRKLLQVFLARRVQAESHAPQWGWQKRKLPYHAQKAVDRYASRSLAKSPWPAPTFMRLVPAGNVRWIRR